MNLSPSVWLKVTDFQTRICILVSSINESLILKLLGVEVKVVVVFDALMSGLPTHKEDFAG